MAVFAYIATTADAATVRGTIIADTAHQARDLLRGRGLAIQRITPSTKRPSFSTEWLRWNKHRSQVVSFIRELSTLLSVGLPLLEAIDTIIKQHQGQFQSVLLTLRDRVSSGTALSTAMSEQPAVFDELCTHVTEVGENAGTLPAVLEQLADYKENALQLRGRIGSMLLYPCVVLTIGLGVSLFLMTFVVPNLLEALLEAGKELPLPTRIVKGISDLLIHHWLLLSFITGGMITTVALILRHPRGKWWWHNQQLRLPLLGEMLRKQTVARMALMLATLLRSGVPFERAIQITQKTTRNLVLRHALNQCQRAIQAGREIALSLEQTQAFPPTVIQVFAIGQQSGKLEQMLERLAKDYDRQVATMSNRLAAIIEPILIVLLAVIVGFVSFATILPILEAGNVF